MPGIIKIGWTDNSIEQRMKELDKTATPLPFTCYYAKRVKDPTFVETKMHQAFDEFRIRNNREFFRMSPEQAKVTRVQYARIVGSPTTNQKQFKFNHGSGV